MQAAMRNSKDEENILHMGRNHRYTRTRSITKYTITLFSFVLAETITCLNKKKIKRLP